MAKEQEQQGEEEFVREDVNLIDPENFAFKGTSLTLVFGKYDPTDVTTKDPGLIRYIKMDTPGMPLTGGKHARKSFGKDRLHIVERLINNVMRTQHYTGKKVKAYRLVESAFAIIAKRTKMNPLQVLVNALERSGPREDVTKLKFGGIAQPKALDVSPSRRVDFAIREIAKGGIAASYKNKKPVEECLASEIIMASNGDPQSKAIYRRDEKERMAASAR